MFNIHLIMEQKKWRRKKQAKKKRYARFDLDKFFEYTIERVMRAPKRVFKYI